MERTTLHIVDGESRSRAEQARIAFALGHHAEVYAGLDELLDHTPRAGVVVAADEGESNQASRVIGRLTAGGVWLPVVFSAATPQIERVVAAIKAGAIDYLQLPLEMNSFARRLEAILAEGAVHARRRRRAVEAHCAIARLSPREREVLGLLSDGRSNKEIARVLAISPRTVEIHRGNMMTKLGAGHVADAVRLWIDARPDTGESVAVDELRGEPDAVFARIGGQSEPAVPVPRQRRQRQ